MTIKAATTLWLLAAYLTGGIGVFDADTAYKKGNFRNVSEFAGQTNRYGFELLLSRYLAKFFILGASCGYQLHYNVMEDELGSFNIHRCFINPSFGVTTNLHKKGALYARVTTPYNMDWPNKDAPFKSTQFFGYGAIGHIGFMYFGKNNAAWDFYINAGFEDMKADWRKESMSNGFLGAGVGFALR